ncbi:MarR family transcriptional regulator [Clavibacter michiganensis subsp. phaseoli]|uniref:MarR family transcriptional regulator n=1 Tax=Clavibacter phaseoli TaxID=1734031 RepID=A0A8I0SFL2_9MICO|nr:MarR family transcriptional regulator [Clavibacter phaseoli]MBF4632605.1 MarR family transcriptional regulator [Clavibacter phaseoli]
MRQVDTRAATLARLRSVTRDMESAALPASVAPLLSLQLTVQQLKVLTVLVTSEDGATGSDLARVFDVSLATVSGLLDRLVGHGVAARTGDPADHRVKRVRATPLGREVVQRLVAARPEFDDDILAGLSDEELAALETGMSAIARQLGRGIA